MSASAAMTPAEVLRAFGERLASGDADGAAALFTEDATYDEPPMASFRGRAAIHGFLADFAARHHDAHFTVARLLASPDGALAAAEWRWEYTRDTDDERRVFEGASFLTFRAGLIASWRGFSARLG
ncbi:MAG TPA: nuclear transport factor 2 family protein [Ktedonobacterales bacterium]